MPLLLKSDKMFSSLIVTPPSDGLEYRNISSLLVRDGELVYNMLVNFFLGDCLEGLERCNVHWLDKRSSIRWQ